MAPATRIAQKTARAARPSQAGRWYGEARMSGTSPWSPAPTTRYTPTTIHAASPTTNQVNAGLAGRTGVSSEALSMPGPSRPRSTPSAVDPTSRGFRDRPGRRVGHGTAWIGGPGSGNVPRWSSPPIPSDARVNVASTASTTATTIPVRTIRTGRSAAARLRDALASALTAAGFDVVGQADDLDSLLALVARERPDVVVADVRMPPTHTTEGLEAARRIRAEHPEIAILVLSQYVETRYAVDLLRENPAGIGYLLKDRVTRVGDLAEALRRVAGVRSVSGADVETLR